MLEALGVHWGDDFIFGIPDDRADDLEQLMREVFKMKICERIGPGILASVEFLHRKVGWNAEGFSWTHDPKHTLAMADGLGYNGKKQLEQTKWKVRKGLRDGADGLDEQQTQQYRSLVGTALYVGQDRPETQNATQEAARFMSGPTRAAKCMLKRLCKYYSEAPVPSWSFPYQEMPSEIRAVTDANWAGELEGLRWKRIRRRSRLWRCQLQRVSTSRSRRVQLTLWRSAVLCYTILVWNCGPRSLSRCPARFLCPVQLEGGPPRHCSRGALVHTFTFTSRTYSWVAHISHLLLGRAGVVGGGTAVIVTKRDLLPSDCRLRHSLI